MDPAIIAVGAGTAGGWLLARLAEPSVKEVGDVIAAPVKRWAERRKAVLERAGQMLRDAGVEPRQVPDDVWVPLLQHAALSPESLQEAWAKLLASAADPRQPPVPPSFPAILAQLSPLEVRVVNVLYTLLRRTPPETLTGEGDAGLDTTKLPGRWNVPALDVAVAVGNLLRQGLITTETLKLDGKTLEPGNKRLQVADRTMACPTDLGRAFFDACVGGAVPVKIEAKPNG